MDLFWGQIYCWAYKNIYRLEIEREGNRETECDPFGVYEISLSFSRLIYHIYLFFIFKYEFPLSSLSLFFFFNPHPSNPLIPYVSNTLILYHSKSLSLPYSLTLSLFFPNCLTYIHSYAEYKISSSSSHFHQ
jgi:hypothetical protein